MAGKVKTICEQSICPEIEKLGYEVVDIEYVKLSDGMNLIFYIDSEQGITLDDCEKVSCAIDPLLDRLNPTGDEGYILQVSSPGIDRPIKTDRDFKRALQKEVEVTLYKKLDGKKKFCGVLTSFDENGFVLLLDGKQTKFDRKSAASIVPVIKV